MAELQQTATSDCAPNKVVKVSARLSGFLLIARRREGQRASETWFTGAPMVIAYAVVPVASSITQSGSYGPLILALTRQWSRSRAACPR